MGRRRVTIRRSARKHDIADDDILSGPLDDEHPQRALLLEFDPEARILELVVLHYAGGNTEVIHAMKARRTYLELLN